jgi:hypothetical protein
MSKPKQRASASWRDRPIDWQQAVRGVPVEDYLDAYELSSPAGRHDAVEDVVYLLESGRWLTWEAVVREEQGLPLGEAHELALDELLDFSDDEEDRVLWIDESARPREPWYATVQRLARTLQVVRYVTSAAHYEGELTAGERLLLAVEEHGEHLSLPPGADRPYDAIGPELWDRLTVQVALDAFSGVGAGAEVVDADRIDWFLRDLKARIASVVALDVSLDDVLAPLVMPHRERERLVRAVVQQLRIRDSTDPIAYPLDQFDPDEEPWDESWPSPWDEDGPEKAAPSAVSRLRPTTKAR